MKIHFLGAARCVTGSMHVLEVGGKRVVLDCGLNQGRRSESYQKNSQLSPVAVGADAVVLSHAHIDPSGNLPTLVSRGFKGSIHATPATVDLCGHLLRDSAKIQAQDVQYLNERSKKARMKDPFSKQGEPVPALYEMDDVEETIRRFRPAEYRKAFEVVPGVRASFYDAGHILGSAIAVLELEEGKRKVRIGFTGDLGRSGQPILQDPQRPPWSFDYLITESTYGDRVHEAIPRLKQKLKEIVTLAFDQGGRVIIPAFAVGRTQNVVYYLNELFVAGELPRVPIFVDSPLSVNATEAYRGHSECFDEETMRILASDGDPFGFKLLTYVRSADESKALNARTGPMVIIASSGMCDAGRILHHLKQALPKPENVVLIVGYQAEHTLGRRLIDRHPKVRIHGEDVRVRCRVEKINGFSAHADREEISCYVKNLEGLRGCFVVHGEEKSSLSLAGRLAELQISGVHVPVPGEVVEL